MASGRRKRQIGKVGFQPLRSVKAHLGPKLVTVTQKQFAKLRRPIPGEIPLPHKGKASFGERRVGKLDRRKGPKDRRKT